MFNVNVNIYITYITTQFMDLRLKKNVSMYHAVLLWFVTIHST